VQADKVVELPGLQGAMDRMALTSPGVVYGFGNINSNGLVFSANGQRARSNNFLLDGQDNNDPTIAGPGYFFSNLEAVGEQNITTPTGSVISATFSSIARSVSTPADNWDAGVHVDYRLSDKMSLTGKYYHYHQTNNTPYSASNGQAGYFIGSPSQSKQAGGS
jgi:hypothetical protein